MFFFTASRFCSSLVHMHLLHNAQLKHSPFVCALRIRHEVMNILDIHHALRTAAVNLAARAAAAQFAHLRQSMTITLRDHNDRRLHRHTATQKDYTDAHTGSSPANCWLLVCKSVIACLIKYRISNELR